MLAKFKPCLILKLSIAPETDAANFASQVSALKVGCCKIALAAQACRRKYTPARFEKDNAPPTSGSNKDTECILERLRLSSRKHEIRFPEVGSTIQFLMSDIELQNGECLPSAISPLRTPRSQTMVALPVNVSACHFLQTRAAKPKVGKDKSVNK